MGSATGGEFANFGRNEMFRPEEVLEPASEEELLRILDARRGRRIRVVGRLHSWSPAAVGEEVLIDLRKMNRVEVVSEDRAEVGAGCQIKRVLSELEKQGKTLCSMGLITVQALAGAAATGTHGSGRNSVSHYVQSVRLAHYDSETGKATIRTIDRGDELRAARCSLGSLGIITSLTIAIRPQYQIEEHFQRYKTLEEVFAQEETYDLQQFFLVPWRWDFLAQHRRETSAPRSKLAWLYRLYWAAGMDVGLHLVVWPLAKVLPQFCTTFFFRYVVPFVVPRGWKVVDRSDRQLTMRHELFRHIEIELFVAKSKLGAAHDFVAWFFRTMAGEIAEPKGEFEERLAASGKLAAIRAAGGVYQHHYPICIRKVLPDEALVSMASGIDEPTYAISVISYAWPNRREGFFRMAELLASSMSELFEARAHWGKYCPDGHREMRRLYPEWERFAEIRRRLDREGAFCNAWARGLFEEE